VRTCITVSAVASPSKRSNGNGADDQREDRIFVRVNAAEKKKFERLARFLHTDLSEIVRQTLHLKADQYLLHERLSKLKKAGG
jgi:hypothetical protein